MPEPALSSSPPVMDWLHRNSQWTYPLYAISLFGVAAIVLFGAWQRDELQVLRGGGWAVAGVMYAFAIFIILLGFSAPRFTHVSLDRITQIGLIWMLGPATASLINGIASLTYPLLNARRRRQNPWQAAVNGLHNAGMFVLCIYATGRIYQMLGGAIPLTELTLVEVGRFLVVYLCMQVFNELFMFLKIAVAFGERRGLVDRFAHGVEFAAAAIALLTALIYNNTPAPVSGLFMLFLIVVIYTSKYLNKVAAALDRRVRQVVTLNAMAKAISSSLVIEELSELLYEQCRKLAGLNDFYFGVYDDLSGQVDYILAKRQNTESETIAQAPRNGLIDWVKSQRKPLYLPSFRQAGDEFRSLLGRQWPGGGSFIGVPIYFRNDVLGIITVQSGTEDAFSRTDYKFIQAMSRQASVAIRNASLFQKLEVRKEELERKVLERTAKIDAQRHALAEMNSSLEDANRRQVELVQALRTTAAELERQSREDPLTGLFNRRQVQDFLAHELDRVHRKGGTLSVALLDLDHFKLVNDNFSHSVGDLTLQAVAKLLRGGVRTLDLAARFGGEEMLICLPDTPLADAVVVCERIRVAIESYDWNEIAPGLRVTASFGVAEYTTGGTMEDLIQRSDEKLYEAKHAGRNQVCA